MQKQPSMPESEPEAPTQSERDAERRESTQTDAGEIIGAPLEDESSGLRRERDDYLAQWQRAQADYQNLRRRTQGEIEQAVLRSQQRLLEELLLALDHLDLALATPHTNEESKKIAHGVQLTRDALLRALAQEGVKPMAPAARFDPARHLAVTSLPSKDREPGAVLDTVRTGYVWGDRVLRPAQVVVAAAPTAAAAGRSALEYDEDES